MNFLTEKGNVSYEKVGDYIAGLNVEKWVNIEDSTQLSLQSIETVLPAFEFFEELGHVELNEERTAIYKYKEIRLIPKRRHESERHQN